MLRLFHRYPATAIQGVLWAVIYLLMLAQSGTIEGITADSGWPLITRLFGDSRASDLLAGQPWRFLTANFLHYSFLHLVINLVGLIQLGRLIEDWYGWGQTLLLCLLIGLFGNLTSACVKLLMLPRLPDGSGLVRSILGQSIYLPSAGGSVIICGLVGLIGVVGWRSRTRFGNFVKGQMLAILLFTFGLGIALPLLSPKSPVMLDNLGHAGGALIGGLFGLLHKRMLKRAEGGSTRRDGVAAIVLMALCFVLQATTYGKERAGIAAAIAAENRRRLEIGRELLFRELQAREQLGRILFSVSRLYEQSARPPILRRDSPLDRATARWAYRAGIPAHQTGLPLRWQSEIEPPTRTAAERLAILRALDRLPGLDVTLRQGAAQAAYLDWLRLANRSLYERPTPAEYARFSQDYRASMDFLGKDLETIRKQIEALGPPESLEAPRPPASDSDPVGDADAEQAEPEP